MVPNTPMNRLSPPERNPSSNENSLISGCPVYVSYINSVPGLGSLFMRKPIVAPLHKWIDHPSASGGIIMSQSYKRRVFTTRNEDHWEECVSYLEKFLRFNGGELLYESLVYHLEI